MTIISPTSDTTQPEPRPTSGVTCSPATEESRLWAATHLAELPTLIRFVDSEVVEWTDPSDGKTFRRAFGILATPSGVSRFRINLRRGASPTDLELAKRLIEDAKNGWFLDWDSFTDPEGHAYLSYSYGIEQRPGSRGHHTILRECDRPDCIDDIHHYTAMGEQADFHHSEQIEHPSDCYAVGILAADNDPWEAWIDASGFDDTDLTTAIKAARDLANDAAWIQAECDRLNSRGGEPACAA